MKEKAICDGFMPCEDLDGDASTYDQDDISAFSSDEDQKSQRLSQLITGEQGGQSPIGSASQGRSWSDAGKGQLDENNSKAGAEKTGTVTPSTKGKNIAWADPPTKGEPSATKGEASTSKEPVQNIPTIDGLGSDNKGASSPTSGSGNVIMSNGILTNLMGNARTPRSEKPREGNVSKPSEYCSLRNFPSSHRSRSPSVNNTPRSIPESSVHGEHHLDSVPESANTQPQIPALLTGDIRKADVISSFAITTPMLPDHITRAVEFLNAIPANVLLPDRTRADGNDDMNLKYSTMPSNSLLQNALVEFLSSGGDDRITLDSRGANKYNTTALPQARGIHRSSCTSNCVTDYSFSKGERLVASLIDAAQNTSDDGGQKYLQHITDIRNSIRKVWKLQDFDCCGITLCPSGSDAEYLPLLLAIFRLLDLPEHDWGNGILSVVTGAGEVGSGTVNAATGKHFSGVSPKPGYHIKNNAPIYNLPKNFPVVECIEVSIRNKGGHVKLHEDVDEEVRDIVHTALKEQNFRFVLVHMVTGCKTGHLVPSLSVLEELTAQYGNAIIPIIDACQGRLQEGALRTLISKGMLVLVTGSKFYGGPPFSGMVLLPAKISKEIDASPHLTKTFDGKPILGDLPLFMDDLLLSDDLPNMKSVIKQHHQGRRPYNWGLVVRWALALNEMTLFHRIPESVRDRILCKWTTCARSLITHLNSPLLNVVDHERRDMNHMGNNQTGSPESQAGMFSINTIVSLVCRVRGGNPYRRLGLAELKKFHTLMSMDLSKATTVAPQRVEVVLPGPYGTHEVRDTRDILATKCFIAQPVVLQPGFKFGLTVIRIAIGAPLVSWIFEKSQRLSILDANGVDKVVNLAAQSDFILLQKMIMILELWEELKNYNPPPK